MLAGIRDILVITTPHEQSSFIELLGDGSQFGISIKYAIQEKPEGLAQAFIIGESFLDGENCLMILGDNIFHGVGLGNQLQQTLPDSGAHIFTYQVAEPSQYGVLNLDSAGMPIKIEEKPSHPTSRLAVTGLYFFDSRVSSVAKCVEPSPRGELEITSVIDWYLQKKELSVTQLSRGIAWLDTGTPKGLHDAASYIRLIEERNGLSVGNLEEIALEKEWIDRAYIEEYLSKKGNNQYYAYVRNLLK
jgi:glucose-1-phosphate thymidylyltransferase